MLSDSLRSYKRVSGHLTKTKTITSYMDHGFEHGETIN